MEEDEPEHRAEFINHLISEESPYSYHHVLAGFSRAMTEANRSNWVSTFKAFITSLSAVLPHTGNGDPLDEAAGVMERTSDPHLDGFDHLDFARLWRGRREGVSEEEYRRAWEHALMNDTLTGTRIIAVASSEHVLRKYPREFTSIINELSKYQLSKAVSGYKKNNL
ncbi:hypothetical protein [Corynebacterium halotolerans]|uniref:hypothetical protein n=1 Tax=Corynebacterium halotolerans TaxID=225326 RepID=UPI003CF4749D